MTIASLLTNPTSAAAKRLAKLADRREALLAQQRDVLARHERARDELARLGRVLTDSEARALAFGEDAPAAKGAEAKVAKLGRQVDELKAESDKLARAIVAIDDETRHVTMTHCHELVDDAVTAHHATRDRIAELVNELNQQQAALKNAYAAAQSVLTTAGYAMAVDLSVPPPVETLVREGGAPVLIAKDDRGAFVA